MNRLLELERSLSDEKRELARRRSLKARGKRRPVGYVIPLGAPDLKLRERVPDKTEVEAVGALKKKIKRTDPEFKDLEENTNADILFKDEEKTGADRMMTPRLCQGLNRLAAAVKSTWSGITLRVTEAWDENNEHSGASLHYEGRAADITTSDQDGGKLGHLARLAVDAGLDWVFFEDERHVHVSVARG